MQTHSYYLYIYWMFSTVHRNCCPLFSLLIIFTCFCGTIRKVFWFIRNVFLFNNIEFKCVRRLTSLRKRPSYWLNDDNSIIHNYVFCVHMSWNNSKLHNKNLKTLMLNLVYNLVTIIIMQMPIIKMFQKIKVTKRSIKNTSHIFWILFLTLSFKEIKEQL